MEDWILITILGNSYEWGRAANSLGIATCLSVLHLTNKMKRMLSCDPTHPFENIACFLWK